MIKEVKSIDGFRDQKYFDLEQAKVAGESRDQVTGNPNDKTALQTNALIEKPPLCGRIVTMFSNL